MKQLSLEAETVSSCQLIGWIGPGLGGWVGLGLGAMARARASD